MNEAIDDADTRTDQSDQNETKDELIIGNCTDKITDPSNGARDPRTDIGKHGRNGICSGSSLKNHTFQKKLFNIH